MRKIAIALVLAAWVAGLFASRAEAKKHKGDGQAGAQAFLGRWDLTITAPDREWPSWIEIAENGGQVSAQFVGRWGNARPLPKIEIDGKHVTFVSPKEEEGSKNDLSFEGTLNGKSLEGTATGPNGTPWKWSGVRAPSLKSTHPLVWGETIQLFNGQDLSGWKPSRAGGPDWKVEDGVLVKPSNGPELISERTFTDFKLHIEFNCGQNANSGVYLRGRYEVQIETESAGESAVHHTGAIYGFIAPTPELPRTPDVWQVYDITLIGRRVTVVLNGTKIVDDQEIPGITGGALNSHEELPGPIYLQGAEVGRVAFRNIVITPAK